MLVEAFSKFPKKSPSRVPLTLAPHTSGPFIFTPKRETTDKKLDCPTALASFPSPAFIDLSKGYKFKWSSLT